MEWADLKERISVSLTELEVHKDKELHSQGSKRVGQSQSLPDFFPPTLPCPWPGHHPCEPHCYARCEQIQGVGVQERGAAACTFICMYLCVPMCVCV